MPFLQMGGSGEEFRAGITVAQERGWIELHESGTYPRLMKATLSLDRESCSSRPLCPEKRTKSRLLRMGAMGQVAGVELFGGQFRAIRRAGYRLSATSLNAITSAFSSFPCMPKRVPYASARDIVGL